MYAVIRQYLPKDATTKQEIEGLRTRIEEKFAPVLQDIPGFHTYAVLNAGDKQLVTISIFEDRNGAAESTRKSAEFVQRDPLNERIGKPGVVEGELLVLKESAVGVR